MKKWSFYKKSFIIFSIILAVLATCFLVYVYNSLVLYERNLVDNYINYLASSGKLMDQVNDNLFKISEYEKDNAKITDGVKKLYNSENLNIKQNKEKSTEDIYVYDLYNNDSLISTVSLKSTKEYKIMAILTSNEWEIVDYENHFDNGIYSYTFEIPENYKLYINDKLVKDDKIVATKDVEGLEELTKFVAIDKRNVYKINNLVYEPDFKILDENNKEVEFKKENNKISITKEFLNIANEEEAKKYIKDDFNIIELAEMWSYFLTNDLAGEYHGLNKLTPYLLEDTEMYNRAKEWSRGPDVNMVSTHTFKNPVFTNEEVKNFIIYNDNAFSVEVYLEKNMIVSHKDKQDIMHDRLYFVYYDGGYKWVKTEAVKD